MKEADVIDDFFVCAVVVLQLNKKVFVPLVIKVSVIIYLHMCTCTPRETALVPSFRRFAACQFVIMTDTCHDGKNREY